MGRVDRGSVMRRSSADSPGLPPVHCSTVLLAPRAPPPRPDARPPRSSEARRTRPPPPSSATPPATAASAGAPSPRTPRPIPGQFQALPQVPLTAEQPVQASLLLGLAILPLLD